MRQTHAEQKQLAQQLLQVYRPLPNHLRHLTMRSSAHSMCTLTDLPVCHFSAAQAWLLQEKDAKIDGLQRDLAFSRARVDKAELRASVPSQLQRRLKELEGERAVAVATAVSSCLSTLRYSSNFAPLPFVIAHYHQANGW